MDSHDLVPIGQIALRAGVAASALRFYEAEGLIAPAHRTEGNKRLYSRDVLRRVAFIRAAQRVGLTLEEIREAMSTLPDDRTPTPEDWTHLSASWRRRLDEQIALVEKLRDDLDSCIGCGCLSLERCRMFNPDDAAARLGNGARYLQGDTPADLAQPPRRRRS